MFLIIISAKYAFIYEPLLKLQERNFMKERTPYTKHPWRIKLVIGNNNKQPTYGYFCELIIFSRNRSIFLAPRGGRGIFLLYDRKPLIFSTRNRQKRFDPNLPNSSLRRAPYTQPCKKVRSSFSNSLIILL